MKPEVLYRYDDIGERVHLSAYPVTRLTEHGAWIDVWGTEKFVLLYARKRFACPTIAEADASFVARKNRQIAILTAQLARVKAALASIRPAEHDTFEVLDPFAALHL